MMMRKACLALLILLMADLSAQSPATPLGTQVTPVSPGYEAPAVVIEKFNASNPTVTESWKKEGDNYSATYIDPKTNMAHVILFDSYGNVLHANEQLADKAYPKAIGEFYKNNFPDEKYEIWLRKDKKGHKELYYSVRNSDTLRFDKNGRNIAVSR